MCEYCYFMSETSELATNLYQRCLCEHCLSLYPLGSRRKKFITLTGHEYHHSEQCQSIIWPIQRVLVQLDPGLVINCSHRLSFWAFETSRSIFTMLELALFAFDKRQHLLYHIFRQTNTLRTHSSRLNHVLQHVGLARRKPKIHTPGFMSVTLI